MGIASHYITCGAARLAVFEVGACFVGDSYGVLEVILLAVTVVV